MESERAERGSVVSGGKKEDVPSGVPGRWECHLFGFHRMHTCAQCDRETETLGVFVHGGTHVTSLGLYGMSFEPTESRL